MSIGPTTQKVKHQLINKWEPILYTYLSDESPPASSPSRKKIREDRECSELLNNFTKKIYDYDIDNFYTESVRRIYSDNHCISGIVYEPNSLPNKYQTYYRKCEYCSTINNVSYEINNCESCGAQFGLLDFLDNVRIAANFFDKHSEETSYKRLALRIIENAFKKHIDFHKNVDDIVNCLTVLSDEKIDALMSYLIGFIKPDKMFKTNE